MNIILIMVFQFKKKSIIFIWLRVENDAIKLKVLNIMNKYNTNI